MMDVFVRTRIVHHVACVLIALQQSDDSLDKENKEKAPSSKSSKKRVEEPKREPESPPRAPSVSRTPLSPRKYDDEDNEAEPYTMVKSLDQKRSPEPTVESVIPPPVLSADKEREPQDLFVIEEDDETANLSRNSIVVDEPAEAEQEPQESRPASPEPQKITAQVTESMVVDVKETIHVREEQPVAKEAARESGGPSSAPKSRPPSVSPIVPESHAEENLGPMDEVIEIPLNDEPEPGHATKNVAKLTYHPLRKSVRAGRDNGIQPVTPGAGLGAGGKRTSWLVKLREQKALEVTKAPVEALPAAPAVRSPGLPSTSKRKSDDLSTAIPPSPARKQKEKKRKVSTPEVADEEMDIGDAGLEMDEQEPLELLKKQVQHLKNSSKSFGGGAAIALAEAKAAAKARVAEKEMTISEPIPRYSEENDITTGIEMDVDPPQRERAPSTKSPVETHSSVVPPHTSKENLPSSAAIFSRPPSAALSQPVFTKPVFVRKDTKPQQEFARSPPTSHPTPAVNVGLSPRLFHPKPKPVSAQSTAESLQPDSLFNDIDDDHAPPTWSQATTQETDYTTSYETQLQQQQQGNSSKYMDDDDSMALEDEEAVKSGVHAAWNFTTNYKDDTFSDQPTESIKAKIRESREKERKAGDIATGSMRHVETGDTNVFLDDDKDEGVEDAFYEDEEALPSDYELERPTVALVKVRMSASVRLWFY